MGSARPFHCATNPASLTSSCTQIVGTSFGWFSISTVSKRHTRIQSSAKLRRSPLLESLMIPRICIAVQSSKQAMQAFPDGIPKHWYKFPRSRFVDVGVKGRLTLMILGLVLFGRGLLDQLHQTIPSCYGTLPPRCITI